MSRWVTRCALERSQHFLTHPHPTLSHLLSTRIVSIEQEEAKDKKFKEKLKKRLQGNKEHSHRHSHITPAIAQEKDKGANDSEEDLKPIRDFVFVGLITLMDPPRSVGS